MDTLKERLKYLIENKKITAYELSSETGVSESAISLILNDKQKKIFGITAERLANYFKVDKNWLMHGEATHSELHDFQVGYSKDCENCRRLEAELILRIKEVDELKSKLLSIYEQNPNLIGPFIPRKRGTG